jgi:hypothetical protein
VSRTDVHTSFAVRIYRGKLGAQEDHDHRNGNCDLPARGTVLRIWLQSNRCSLTLRWTGVAVCSCPMCHAGQWHRQANRNSRHRDRDRVMMAQARKTWNCGDTASFDDLAAPNKLKSC